MSTNLSNRQSTATPKLTKTQRELLDTMAMPGVTHLCIGFRGAFIGGDRARGKTFRNETAQRLMQTAYLTRWNAFGTSGGYYYTISDRGRQELSTEVSS
jgi:hypothetical protein